MYNFRERRHIQIVNISTSFEQTYKNGIIQYKI